MFVFKEIKKFSNIKCVFFTRNTGVSKGIYKSLNWSGGFVLFEKVRSPDARFQDLMTQVYSEYKNDVGYNEKQIYHKAVSIRGFLEPFTSTANKAYLKRAGFKDILTIQKYGPFEGILAIK